MKQRPTDAPSGLRLSSPVTPLRTSAAGEEQSGAVRPAPPRKNADSLDSTAAVPLTPRLLRLPEVMNIVGLRRAAIYQLVREGRFPKGVRITERAVGWVEAEVQAWVAERIRMRAPAVVEATSGEARLQSHDK